MSPKLSLILTPTDDWNVHDLTISSVENQVLTEGVEFILVCSSRKRLDLPEQWSRLPYRIVETGYPCLVHELRAIGVREASGEYVALIEDHVHLSPDWTSQVLARLDEGWAAVSGSVQPGNDKTPLTEAMFLLTYAQWYRRSGEQINAPLSGHNTAYRRELLLKLDDLETAMACPVIMQSVFRRTGLPPLFTNEIKIRHWDPTTFRSSLHLLWALGKCLGTIRTEKWQAALRVAYSAAFPVVAAKHFSRGFLELLRLRKSGSADWNSLPWLIFWSALWGLAEAYGSLWPRSKYYDRLSELEVNRWRFAEKPRMPYNPW